MRLQLQVYLPGRSGGASVRNTAPQELPAGIWTDVEATLPPGPSTKIAQTVVNVAGPPIDDFPTMTGSSLKKVLPSAGESALNEDGAIAGSACPSLRSAGGPKWVNRQLRTSDVSAFAAGSGAGPRSWATSSTHVAASA